MWDKVISEIVQQKHQQQQYTGQQSQSTNTDTWVHD